MSSSVPLLTVFFFPYTHVPSNSWMPGAEEADGETGPARQSWVGLRSRSSPRQHSLCLLPPTSSASIPPCLFDAAGVPEALHRNPLEGLLKRGVLVPPECLLEPVYQSAPQGGRSRDHAHHSGNLAFTMPTFYCNSVLVSPQVLVILLTFYPRED